MLRGLRRGKRRGRREAERATRVLRGVLHLAGREPPGLAAEIVADAATHTSLRLDGLQSVVGAARYVDFGAFERFYQDLAALADYMDRLDLAHNIGARSASEGHPAC